MLLTCLGLRRRPRREKSEGLDSPGTLIDVCFLTSLTSCCDGLIHTSVIMVVRVRGLPNGHKQCASLSGVCTKSRQLVDSSPVWVRTKQRQTAHINRRCCDLAAHAFPTNAHPTNRLGKTRRVETYPFVALVQNQGRTCAEPTPMNKPPPI